MDQKSAVAPATAPASTLQFGLQTTAIGMAMQQQALEQKETGFIKQLISGIITQYKNAKVEKNAEAEKGIITSLENIVSNPFQDMNMEQIYTTVLLNIKSIVSPEYQSSGWFSKPYKPAILTPLSELHTTLLGRQQKWEQEEQARKQKEEMSAAEQAREEKKKRKAAEKQAEQAQQALRFAEQQRALDLQRADLDKREAVAKVTEEMAQESRAAVAEAGYQGAMFAIEIAAQYVAQHRTLGPIVEQTFQAQGGIQNALLLAYKEQTVGEQQESQADTQPKTELEKCEEKFGATKYPIVSAFVDLYNTSKSETEKLMAQYIIAKLTFQLVFRPHDSTKTLLLESGKFFMLQNNIIPEQFPKFKAVMEKALAIAAEEKPASNNTVDIHEQIKFFIRRYQKESDTYTFIPEDDAALLVFGQHHENIQNGTEIPEEATEAGYQKTFEKKLKALLQSSPTFTLRAKATAAEGASTNAAAPNGDNGHKQPSPQ